MRTIDEIRKDLDRAQHDESFKSIFVRMLEGNTPESELKCFREELKLIEQRMQQLKAELREAS